jgi:hypothetical protein
MEDHSITRPKITPIDPVEYLGEEVAEWIAMTPQQRWAESSLLWHHYVSLGGSLDPVPDTQSPFYDPDERRSMPTDGRPSLHIIRRGGV